MKHWLVVLGVVAATLAAACDDNGNQDCPTTTPCPTCTPCPASPAATTATRTPTAIASPIPSPTPMVMADVFLDNADIPVALAFAPDGRLFYNELRTGRFVSWRTGDWRTTPSLPSRW